MLRQRRCVHLHYFTPECFHKLRPLYCDFLRVSTHLCFRDFEMSLWFLCTRVKLPLLLTSLLCSAAGEVHKYCMEECNITVECVMCKHTHTLNKILCKEEVFFCLLKSLGLHVKKKLKPREMRSSHPDTIVFSQSPLRLLPVSFQSPPSLLTVSSQSSLHLLPVFPSSPPSLPFISSQSPLRLPFIFS